MGEEPEDGVEGSDDRAPEPGVDLIAPLAAFFIGGLIGVRVGIRFIRHTGSGQHFLFCIGIVFPVEYCRSGIYPFALIGCSGFGGHTVRYGHFGRLGIVAVDAGERHNRPEVIRPAPYGRRVGVSCRGIRRLAGVGLAAAVDAKSGPGAFFGAGRVVLIDLIRKPVAESGFFQNNVVRGIGIGFPVIFRRRDEFYYPVVLAVRGRDLFGRDRGVAGLHAAVGSRPAVRQSVSRRASSLLKSILTLSWEKKLYFDYIMLLASRQEIL